MKAIGSSFPSELQAAGLLGLPFSWGADGVIQFGLGMTAVQIAAVQMVYAAHDPTKLAPPPPPNPLKALILAALSDPTIPTSLKAVLTAWNAQL